MYPAIHQAIDQAPVDLNAAYRRSGTRFRVFAQPPVLRSVQRPETIWLSSPNGEVGPGPSDRRMYVCDADGKISPYEPPQFPPYAGPVHPPAKADVSGHFDYLPEWSRQFQAAHMYAVVRRVLDVWECYFEAPLRWHFEGLYERLELIPEVHWDNAHSGFGFIEMGYRANEEGEVQVFALNFDVVAHELGHSIIYSKVGSPRPDTESPEYFGFQESAADITALIAALHFDSVVDRLLASTRGNLYVLNELNRIAELSENDQIRVASNSARMSDYAHGWEKEHHLSLPLTGALFDVLVEIFQELLVHRGLISPELDARSQGVADSSVSVDPVQSVQMGFDAAYAGQHAQFRVALLQSRDYLGRCLARVWEWLDPHHFGYVNVGHLLMDADQELSGGQFQNIIFESFARREIGRISPGPRLGQPVTDGTRSCR